MAAYNYIKADFKDIFCKPWEIIERIKAFMRNRDDTYIVQDCGVALELNITPMHLSGLKSRGTSTIILYVTRWCILKEYDPKPFIRSKA